MKIIKKIIPLIAALTLLLPAPVSAIEFSSHGYYRLRFEYTHDLDLQHKNANIVANDPEFNNTNDRLGAIAFAQQRFRLNPIIKLNDHISFHGQIDFLDNLLFGQSDVASLEISNPITGRIALPAANGPFGVVGSTGGDAAVGSGGGNINVRRLYVDLLTAGGKFRIGRQGSHWGLGILSNDGDGREADFGDTFDSILYLAGLDLNKYRLNFGFLYAFAYEAQQDPSLAGFDSGFNSNWNDAMQTGLILLLQAENFEVGTFGTIRFRDGNDGQPTTTAISIDAADADGDGNTVEGIEGPAGIDGDTFLYIIDTYGRINILKNYRVGFEAVYIGGKIAPGVAIDAIVLDDPSQADLTNPLPDPIELQRSDISVFLAALEADAFWDFGGEAHIQAGFASGDSAPLSSKITQLGFRPDYDIALMMFDVPLGTSPAIRVNGITEQGRKPVTPNYVNNAIYFTAQYKHEFDVTSGIPWAEDFKVGGKLITAFAPSRNLDIDFAEITGVGNLPRVVNRSRWYGIEADLSVEATLFEFMHWQTTAGAFIPGGVYDIKNDDIASNQGGIINAILFDGADPAFAIKTSFVFEF